MQAMVDSGSSGTFINKSAAEKLNLFIMPKSKTIPLADKKSVAKIIGEVVINIDINGHEHRGVVAEVIKNLCTDIIIGRDIQRKHSRVILNFNGPREELVIGAMPTSNSSATSTQLQETKISTPSASTMAGFGTINIPPPPLFTHLSSNIKPVATKSRRQSPANQRFIKAEVSKLYKAGIIRSSVSPWRAQAFITKEDGTHKKRMVVDYSETINLFTELDAYPMPSIPKMVQDMSQYKYFSTFDLKSAYHQIPIREEDCKYTAFEADGKLWEFTTVPFGVTNGVSAFQRTIDKVLESEGVSDTFAYVDNVHVCGRTKEEHDQNVITFKKVRDKHNITLNDEKTVECTTSLTTLGYTISNNIISPDLNRLKPLLEMPPPLTFKSQKRIVGMFSYYSKFIENFSKKIRPLNQNRTFPLTPAALEAFQLLTNDLKDAALKPIDPEGEFEVETDASDFCIAATLNQQGRPVAFFSRTLNQHEIGHHAVEKEAAAIVESVREWRHFLIGRKFKLITDQRSVSYMYDCKRKSKIKNVKIARWRVELSQFKFDIIYRPGDENLAADTFSRIASIGHPMQELHALHKQLCHPGVSRLSHFVRSKNLPFTLDQVRTVNNSCKSCAFLKPRFMRSEGTLIKATAPFQRLSLDFKGPLPTSKKGNQYLLTIIDEYSRFPFAYPCHDMTSKTIIQSLNHLFSIFGMPDMVHNDRGTDFLSEETQNFLFSKGIATSKTSRYNPQGNGQVEKLNGTLWKAIQVTLHSRKLKLSDWESVLPDALHSIRSLLCTATNQTPHERMFNFQRKSTSGKGIPTWLKAGPVYVKDHTRRSKNDPPVTTATLLHANPEYAHVRLPSGTETTVSVRDIARHPSTMDDFPEERVVPSNSEVDNVEILNTEEQTTDPIQSEDQYAHNDQHQETLGNNLPEPPRRSTRAHKQPTRFGFDDFVMK